MPVSSGTDTLPWKTSNSLAIQELDTLFCSRGPWTRTSGLQCKTQLESDVTSDMGTCLPQSRAHSRGNTFSLPCKTSNVIGERKRNSGRAGHSSQLRQSSSGFPTMTSKPSPMPFQAASKFASSHVCTGMSKHYMPFTTADPFVSAPHHLNLH